jgi:Protein of unknown function (DUF2795)
MSVPSVAAAKRGYRPGVYADVATLQVLLEGVPLPARKAKLIEYARKQNEQAPLHMLDRLPDREYSSIDEVGEALVPVQPRAARAGAELPREESDLPPGGDDYVNPRPTPGAVRHDAPPDNPPQKAIERQTKAQNEQQERQKKRLGE